MPSNAPKFTFRQWPFLFPLSGVISGIILQESFRPGKDVWLVCFLVSFFICLLSRLTPHHRPYLVRTVALWLPFLFTGGLLRSYEDHRNAPEWYGHHLTASTALLVEVNGRPEMKAATIFLPARVIRYRKNGKWIPALGNLNLYLYKNAGASAYQHGDRLLIPAEAIPFKHQGGRYGFDYAAYMALNNTYHQSFFAGHQVQRLPSPGKPDLVKRLQQGILHSLDRNIPDGATRALAAAILLNHRTNLEDSLVQAYAATGITHIIAISGMHVSLLFGLFLILLNWIRHKKHEWIKYLLAVPLVWGYILLTGFPPSAVRAGVMFSFLALGMALGKSANPINLLAATAFVLLCVKPAWLYDVGVQLSFLAVLSILLFYKPLSALLPASNSILKFLRSSIAVCLAAQVLVFPLVIYYFHQFPVWVLPANIPATFFSFLLMVGSLLILVLDSFHLPASWLGELLSRMTQIFHELIYFFSGHAPDFSHQLYLDIADFWFLMLAVVSLSIFMLRRSRPFAYAALSFFILMLSGQIYQDFYARRQRQLVVYPLRRQGFADYFTGKQVWTIGAAPDTIDEKAFRYTIFPSRLGRRAVQTAGHLAGREAFIIRKKRILYLRKPLPLPDSLGLFKVDFLILSNPPELQARKWIACFQPEQIILDGSFPAWKAEKWTNILQALHVPVHNVSEHGAWRFPRPE